MNRSAIAVALLLFVPARVLAGGAAGSWTNIARWSAQTTPKAGPPRAIGAYDAGCLQGGGALPPEAPGYELLHLGRHRFFGHPTLLRFVRGLAERALDRGLPRLLVGDLSQARGGPTPSDHGSHQSGLDVDIAYVRPPFALHRPLSAAEREELHFPPVVDLASGRLGPAWTPRIAELLELAATDPAVDRIFVNAVIKRELCSSHPGAAWLGRLRPWWGHDDHFHVRLRCPRADSSCRSQTPVPPGTGCDQTLAWWLNQAAHTSRAEAPKRARTAPARLPAECRAVLR